MKPAIHTTLSIKDLKTNGSGDLFRMSITQNIHSAPKPVMGREAVLVMEKDEATDLAIQILYNVPVLGFSGAQKTMLKKLINLTNALKK